MLPEFRGRQTGRDGFTLIDLLALIAIMAVLASLLLPALAKGGPNGQGLQCLNNLKQLTVAWSMYANDNNDRLIGAQRDIIGLPNWPTWMTGGLDFSSGNTSNWDTNRDITLSPLWPYAGKQAGLLKCPADQSTVIPSSGPYIGQRVPRVRSVSMSQVFGTGGWLNGLYNPSQTVWRTYHKGADIVIPAKTFLFADEHPDSINDGSLAVQCAGADSPSNARIIDFPANYHNGAGVFSFSDGHTEVHNWIGSKIRDAPIYYSNATVLNVLAVDSWVDVQWLAEHTTVRR